jgi:hypothetical protein
MSTLRQAAQQALEALEQCGLDDTHRSYEFEHVARIALRAALAQQGKPVAVHQFRKQYCANWYDGHPDHTDGGGPYEERTLYAHPPRREWQSLTNEEIYPLYNEPRSDAEMLEFARAVEQALKEKNA